jgi:hypothetical protein
MVFFFYFCTLERISVSHEYNFSHCRFLWLISQVVKLQVNQQVKVFGGGSFRKLKFSW